MYNTCIAWGVIWMECGTSHTVKTGLDKWFRHTSVVYDIIRDTLEEHRYRWPRFIGHNGFIPSGKVNTNAQFRSRKNAGVAIFRKSHIVGGSAWCEK